MKGVWDNSYSKWGSRTIVEGMRKHLTQPLSGGTCRRKENIHRITSAPQTDSYFLSARVGNHLVQRKSRRPVHYFLTYTIPSSPGTVLGFPNSVRDSHILKASSSETSVKTRNPEKSIGISGNRQEPLCAISGVHPGTLAVEKAKVDFIGTLATCHPLLLNDGRW